MGGTGTGASGKGESIASAEFNLAGLEPEFGGVGFIAELFGFHEGRDGIAELGEMGENCGYTVVHLVIDDFSVSPRGFADADDASVAEGEDGHPFTLGGSEIHSCVEMADAELAESAC